MTREGGSPRALLMAVALATAIASCPLSAAEARGPSGTTFFVYYHSPKGPIYGRKDVEVFQLGAVGPTRLGTTNADGEITLSVAQVVTAGGVALLFCDPKRPQVCAALRVDSDFLKGFAEFNVHLPLIETIDRIRITPR